MDETVKAPLIGRRELILGGAMALTSGLAFARTPKPYVAPLKMAAFEAAVPKAVGPWRQVESGSVVLPPPDALSERLYDNLLTRVYLDPDGRAVMLVMAYKNVQDGIVQVHRPEVCYPAAGFVLESERHQSLRVAGNVVPTKAFAARRPDRVEQVLYFTRLGRHFPLSWSEQRWAVLDANLAGQIPDGLLARVSIIQNDQSSAIALLSGFVETLSAQAGPTLRAILTGSAPSS